MGWMLGALAIGMVIAAVVVTIAFAGSGEL